MVYGVLKASENANESDDNEVRLEGMLGNDEKVKHLVKFSTPPIAWLDTMEMFPFINWQPRVSFKKSRATAPKILLSALASQLM